MSDPTDPFALPSPLTLQWNLNPALSPEEHARLQAMGADPMKYGPLLVMVQIAEQIPGQITMAQTDDGPPQEVAILSALIVIPTAALRVQRLLGPDGTIPDPLAGRCPILSARLLVPAARLAGSTVAGMAASYVRPRENFGSVDPTNDIPDPDANDG